MGLAAVLPLLELLQDKFVHDQLPSGIALVLGKREEDKTWGWLLCSLSSTSYKTSLSMTSSRQVEH